MPTLTEIRDAVDARLAVLWPKLRARQAAYLAAKGRYWQGLRTPAALPVDGASLAPDVTLRPTDQAETWAAAVGADLNPTEPMRLTVDVYDGPLGQGFTATAEVKLLDGRVFERCANDGPEAWRAYGWRQQAVVP